MPPQSLFRLSVPSQKERQHAPPLDDAALGSKSCRVATGKRASLERRAFTYVGPQSRGRGA